jgi:hypothetical protein
MRYSGYVEQISTPPLISECVTDIDFIKAQEFFFTHLPDDEWLDLFYETTQNSRCMDIIHQRLLTVNIATLKRFLEYRASSGLADWVLLTIIKHPNELISQIISADTETPLSVLIVLAQSNDYSARCSVVEHRNSTVSLVNSFTEDENYSVRKRVALSHLVTEKNLIKLSFDPNEEVRAEVVVNPILPTKNLASMVNDNDVRVRCHVASRKGMFPEILEKLAEDDFENVREAVARNHGTEPDVLHLLARDKTTEVRWNVVNNPAVNIATLEILLYDEDDYVRGKAIIAMELRQLMSWNFGIGINRTLNEYRYMGFS